MLVEEEDEEDEFEKLLRVQNFPASQYLEEAKKMEYKNDEIDENFIIEYLTSLDKDLPQVPIYDTKFQV